MNWLSDQTVERLRLTLETPDLTGTYYEIVEQIGRGGMAAVYAARDIKLDRIVALKLLTTSSAADRMRREVRILARLEHPGIIPIHDTGTLADGRTWYAMKLVRGERLDEYLRRDQPLSERLRLFERICDPVAFAHSRGIIHRDLKPQNIMIGEFGEVLVLDWGAAKVTAAPQIDAPVDGGLPGDTEHGTVVGTEGFMSPEQSAGAIEKVDERSDIFALGRILKQIAGANPPRPLAAVCAKATAPEPAGRYVSVHHLARDISSYLDGEPLTAYSENVIEKIQRWTGRNKLVVSLVAAYLLMRALLLFLRGV